MRYPSSERFIRSVDDKSSAVLKEAKKVEKLQRVCVIIALVVCIFTVAFIISLFF